MKHTEPAAEGRGDTTDLQGEYLVAKVRTGRMLRALYDSVTGPAHKRTIEAGEDTFTVFQGPSFKPGLTLSRQEKDPPNGKTHTDVASIDYNSLERHEAGQPFTDDGYANVLIPDALAEVGVVSQVFEAAGLELEEHVPVNAGEV